MGWKEFFDKDLEELLSGKPLVQLHMKDGSCIQGRLLDASPFVIVESNMRTDDDYRPTGRMWVAEAEDMASLKLIPDLIPATWEGFDEAAQEGE